MKKKVKMSEKLPNSIKVIRNFKKSCQRSRRSSPYHMQVAPVRTSAPVKSFFISAFSKFFVTLIEFGDLFNPFYPFH